MNYSETIDFLFNQLAMYQRDGGKAYKANLDNTLFFAQAADQPQQKFKSIHIAGTNGKGSVAHILASIFQEAGYKTGLFSSPHFIDFRERIKVNGEMISEQSVCQFVEFHQNSIEEIQPSFFEITTIMAFSHFASQNVDIAIIETGLGGRLDSTNIILPEVSVITNVSIDHSTFLGNDISSIAKEKAGIIKSKIPVVLGKMSKEAHEIMEITSEQLESPISNAIPLSLIPKYSSLSGEYQKENISTSLATIKLLKTVLPITQHQIELGLSNIYKNTGFAGRWQEISSHPRVIIDAGHNEAGFQSIIKNINCTTFSHLHILLGLSSDKDFDSILSLLPSSASYYYPKVDNSRLLSNEELIIFGKKHGLKGESANSVLSSYNQCLSNYKEGDLILIIGSFFLISDFFKEK